MILVRRGEHGPRVALIQILLNRAGSALNVDGRYGPLTAEAVSQFQRNHHLAREDRVGSEMWRKFPRGDNTRVVDVVDIGDYSLGSQVVSGLQSVGGDPIQLGLMCGGIEQMVQAVISKAEGHGRIALLRIIGHGNRGRWMTVSVGDIVDLSQREYEIWKTEYHSYIDLEHADEVLPILARLRTLFAPYGQAEHGGCSLGSQPKTRELMHKLADLWNVPVSAGISLQRSILHFDGTVFTAYPKGGSLESWSARLRGATF